MLSNAGCTLCLNGALFACHKKHKASQDSFLNSESQFLQVMILQGMNTGATCR